MACLCDCTMWLIILPWYLLDCSNDTWIVPELINYMMCNIEMYNNPTAHIWSAYDDRNLTHVSMKAYLDSLIDGGNLFICDNASWLDAVCDLCISCGGWDIILYDSWIIWILGYTFFAIVCNTYHITMHLLFTLSHGMFNKKYNQVPFRNFCSVNSSFSIYFLCSHTYLLLSHLKYHPASL